MTPEQTRDLARIAWALNPNQQMTAETPNAWHLLLGELEADEAAQALQAVAKTNTWINPADILATAKRARRDRLSKAGHPTPNTSPDDIEAWQAELRAIQTKIATGQWTKRDIDAYERGETPTLTGCTPRFHQTDVLTDYSQTTQMKALHKTTRTTN